jgi:hypothetical protein
MTMGEKDRDDVDEGKAADLAKRLFAMPPQPRKDTKAAKPARKPKASKGQAP